MKVSTGSVSAHHVRAVLLGGERRGIAPAPLLARAGLPAELLGDGQARVPAERFGRLVRMLWALLDDELIGFGGAPCKVGTFAMMGHVVVHGSRDLREALRRGQDFYSLFPSGPRFRLVEPGAGGEPGEVGEPREVGVPREVGEPPELGEPREAGEPWEVGDPGVGGKSGLGGESGAGGSDEARMEFDIAGYDDPLHFGAESTVLVAHRFAGWLIRRRIGLRRVEFAYPEPRHAQEYALLFGAPCVFGARRTAAVFDRADLDAPVLRDAAALQAFLRRAPAGVLVRADHGGTVTGRVRHLIGKALPAEPVPTPQQLADRLSMSPQTLRRRLAAEGTTYQRLRDQVRRDHAIAELSGGRVSIELLSRQLGFSEPSAFHRAFRRWTGETPRAYRARGG
ncbi:AraC family transcriptional regulator [Streptomyces sp. NPDC033754]|uniref:AraC family transcriptional regulator n=1 Tax=unclassified Streptomyces TaxID=2593676 RepID=UPI0033D76E28